MAGWDCGCVPAAVVVVSVLRVAEVSVAAAAGVAGRGAGCAGGAVVLFVDGSCAFEKLTAVCTAASRSDLFTDNDWVIATVSTLKMIARRAPITINTW